MNSNKPIYTESNNCQDCYKCIRHCPVKAIRIAGNCASVIDELCIACGKCVEVCPVGAKKIRSDLEMARLLVKSGKKVVMSLAPSWACCFPGISSKSMIPALKQLGFYAISETALGAEMVNRYTRAQLINKKAEIVISSACPSVVDLVKRHYPQYENMLLSAYSPMLAHAQYLKNYYGPDTHIIFAGPCIAKKRESDKHRNLVDAALTFQELQDWLDDEWINFEDQNEKEYHFEPVEAVSGAIYPIDGGMITGIDQNNGPKDVQYMSFTGIESITDVFKDLGNWKPKQNIFIELMMCAGGCINGPAVPAKSSVAIRQSQILDLSASKARSIGIGKELVYPLDISSEEAKNYHLTIRKQHSAADIMEAMKAVGKQTIKDELNCGGCGYESCREFAIAMLEGKAERNMCVSYMRRVAHDKATVLLQRMPSGVMVVDENLRVVECNLNMARMLGEEAILIFENNTGLSGADVTKLVPFHKMFMTVLNTGKDLIDRDVKLNGHFLKVSVFTVQSHKTVCAIVRDLFNPEVRNDEIVSRTRSIIKENLGTVQQIAYLLGENASKTETMLNSILEILKEDNQNEEEVFSC